jgi:hypothetical protein
MLLKHKNQLFNISPQLLDLIPINVEVLRKKITFLESHEEKTIYVILTQETAFGLVQLNHIHYLIKM